MCQVEIDVAESLGKFNIQVMFPGIIPAFHEGIYLLLPICGNIRMLALLTILLKTVGIAMEIGPNIIFIPSFFLESFPEFGYDPGLFAIIVNQCGIIVCKIFILHPFYSISICACLTGDNVEHIPLKPELFSIL